MEQLPNDWLALLMLVFILGVKHGLDADHLATVDGITRFNAVNRPTLARWSGVLFSLGHGAVVTLIAVVVGLAAREWQTPEWIDGLGAWISILFLLSLGAVNVWAVLRTDAGEVVSPVGVKGRLFGRFTRTSHPLLIMLVGALFALSFDTMSQAAVFSMAATTIGGWGFGVTLGLVFMLGMIVTDGFNGLWISRLLHAADRRALVASRVMGLSVGGLSLLVGLFGLAKWFFPAVGEYSEGRELWFGMAVVAVVLISYLIALRLAGDNAHKPNMICATAAGVPGELG